MKEGKSIESDCFDSVSIYVSDIVDFHPLIAVSTPKEVRIYEFIYIYISRTITLNLYQLARFMHGNIGPQKRRITLC